MVHVQAQLVVRLGGQVQHMRAVISEVLDDPRQRRLAVALALLVLVDCCPLSPLLETLSGLWLGLGRVRLSLDLSRGRGRWLGLGNRFRLSLAMLWLPSLCAIR